MAYQIFVVVSASLLTFGLLWFLVLWFDFPDDNHALFEHRTIVYSLYLVFWIILAMGVYWATGPIGNFSSRYETLYTVILSPSSSLMSALKAVAVFLVLMLIHLPCFAVLPRKQYTRWHLGPGQIPVHSGFSPGWYISESGYEGSWIFAVLALGILASLSIIFVWSVWLAAGHLIA